MMGLLNFVQKRPSDFTINTGRILFGIILIISLYYNLIIQGDNIENNFFWIDIPENYLIYIKYFFIGLGAVPLIMGITQICLLKKKYMRIIQIIFGIFLFYISGKIIPLDQNKLDVDTLVAIMGVLPLFAGITGKCILSKCLKYKEKITKIRV